MTPKQVTIAWTHAVRHTADALDRPNWEKALLKLEEFHPSWIILKGQSSGVVIDLASADDDKPDAR